MTTVIIIGILFYLLMNSYALYLMKEDKFRAKQKKRRISERRLFVISFLGGAIGVWSGMHLYRHKTKHRSFVIGIPALFFLHIGTIYGIVQLYQFYFE